MDFSVIVPTYNSERTLRLTLESLKEQTASDYEVIVVDDASTDNTAELVAAHDVRYERMETNQGPAAARNHGVSVSRGRWLVFTDADTEFEPDTLEKIKKCMESSDAEALVGIYAGEPANEGFMPRYKALWEYYAINMGFLKEQKDLYPLSSWAPRPGVIARKAFDAVGGFDARFRGADIEDMELGYRLYEGGHPIYYAPAVHIRHHYPETLMGALRPFTKRSCLWTRTMVRRKKMDAVGDGSPMQAVMHMFGFGTVAAAAVTPLLPPLGYLALGGFLGYTALNMKFLSLALREEGPWFAARSYGVRWLFSVSAGLGAGYGVLTARREKDR